MKKIYDCWYEDASGRLGRSTIYADTIDEAISLAREYFRDYEYLNNMTATITAQEFDMDTGASKHKQHDIANQEEWDRAADEEEWAEAAAKRTQARRDQKSDR